MEEKVMYNQNTEVKRIKVEKSLFKPDNIVIPEKPNYIFSAEELLSNDIKEIPMLLEPFFPKVGLVTLVGGSDTGKSTFLREFSLALTSEQEHYLDFKLNPVHGSVLYVSTEDDSYAISSLLKKQNTFGQENADFKNFNFLFDTNNFMERLEEELYRNSYDCLIIDAFSDIFAGDLHRVNEVRNFLQKYSNLANKKELLIIFLHHTGKGKDLIKPSKNSILGSQGFEAKMRMVAELRIDPNDPVLRHFCVLKGNYITTEHKEKSYVLEFEDLKFKKTDMRVPLDEIFIKEDNKEKKAMKTLAKKLKEEGLTVRKIAEEMGKKGYSICHATIHNWNKDE